jgi:hypothetical protein
MKYKLSVLVPGIRTHNWKRLYDSIKSSTKESFEMIFVGPYELPTELQGKENIKFIQDYGTPIRCQQIALTESEGEWITWAADDGYYVENALDDSFSIIENNNDYKTVVFGKYFEGEGNEEIQDDIQYHKLNFHPATRTVYIPMEYMSLNCGVVSRQLLIEIGGWDCSFEVCPMSYADFAIRSQNYGANFIIQDNVMFKCGHMPGTSGDHAPIHYAQITHDEPLFQQMYNSPECLSRVKIEIDNWKSCPDKWTRRFK